MPALYPNMVAPEDFRPGDCVRKWITEWNVTPFVGTVTHIAPAACKVWVQWPIEHSSESPETLVKVNPMLGMMPATLRDKGYSSYEKSLSEKLYGRIPKGASETDKMAIRIAHTFAVETVGKLVDDIVAFKDQGLSDVQTYNRIYGKYASICSDYIMQSSIKRVYAVNVKPLEHSPDASKRHPAIYHDKETHERLHKLVSKHKGDIEAFLKKELFSHANINVKSIEVSQAKVFGDGAPLWIRLGEEVTVSASVARDLDKYNGFALTKDLYINLTEEQINELEKK